MLHFKERGLWKESLGLGRAPRRRRRGRGRRRVAMWRGIEASATARTRRRKTLALLPEKTEKNLDNNLCITSHSIPSLTLSVFLALSATLYCVDCVIDSSAHVQNRPHWFWFHAFDECEAIQETQVSWLPTPFPDPAGILVVGTTGELKAVAMMVEQASIYSILLTIAIKPWLSSWWLNPLLYQLFQSTHCAENVNFGVQTLDRLVSVWTDFGEELELHHSSPSKKLLYIASRESQQQPQTLTLIMISHSQFSKPLHSHICTN